MLQSPEWFECKSHWQWGLNTSPGVPDLLSLRIHSPRRVGLTVKSLLTLRSLNLGLTSVSDLLLTTHAHPCPSTPYSPIPSAWVLPSNSLKSHELPPSPDLSIATSPRHWSMGCDLKITSPSMCILSTQYVSKRKISSRSVPKPCS